MVYQSVWPDPVELPQGNAASFLLSSPYLTAPHNQSRALFIEGLNSEFISTSQFRTLVPRAACLFRDYLGIDRGSVTLIFGENLIWTAVMHFATLWLGGIVSPSNAMYNAEELAHQIKMVHPKVIFAGQNQIPVVEEAPRITGADSKIVSFNQLIEKLRSVEKLPAPLALVNLESQETAYYCMSSGTSGLPKVVVTSHGNISSNIAQELATCSPFHDRTLNVCAVLPLSHIFGLNAHLWVVPYLACTSVILPKFNEEDLLNAVKRYKIGVLYLVPPILLTLSNSKILDSYPEFAENVRYILSAAAPLSKILVEKISLRAPKTHIWQQYGLTEASFCTHFGGRDESYDPEKIGWLVPGTQARLVDPESEEDVEELGRPGELYIKGPQIMQGYLNNPESTASTFDGDWFKTGDVAIVDETGQFQIVDRIKELIKSKGHQVAPAELESILLTSENVIDAAVTGVPDSHNSTELPRAFLVVKKGANPLDILDWFNKRVARHKRLWGGIVTLDAIPKSPSGKILRRLLRKREGDAVILSPAAKL